MIFVCDMICVLCSDESGTCIAFSADYLLEQQGVAVLAFKKGGSWRLGWDMLCLRSPSCVCLFFLSELINSRVEFENSRVVLWLTTFATSGVLPVLLEHFVMRN